MTQADAASNTTALTVADINTAVNCEPRVLDTVLGTHLGMAQPLNIRGVIESATDELTGYGSIFTHRVKNPGRGRPGKAYYLTEGQALCVCALSRAPNAPSVRRALIEAFMELRRRQTGASVPVRAHERKPAARRVPGSVPKAALETYSTWLYMERVAVLAELYPDKPPGHRTGVIASNPGAFYHRASDDEVLPPPSTRAVQVLRTVGCPVPKPRKAIAN